MATSRWAALVLELPEVLEEEIAGVLGCESLGVEVVPQAVGLSRVRVYLGSPSEAESLLLEAAMRLKPWGLTPCGCNARLEPVDDLAWVERYQESLRPLPLGQRFLVVPRGRPPRATRRTPILLVPGRAFGTGEHPTTRLCAEALERSVYPGSVWLDLGSGSGILSVVAAHCGAARVVALDVDPEAVEVAREVLERNGVSGTVTVEIGSADRLAGTGFDGAVANLASSYFLSQTPEAAAVLRPHGTLIASGFLREEAAQVAEVFENEGLRVVERRRAGEWGLLLAVCGVKARSTQTRGGDE